MALLEFIVGKKVKILLVLINLALCYEDICGREGISPPF
jgi:hypothetical protein